MCVCGRVWGRGGGGGRKKAGWKNKIRVIGDTRKLKGNGGDKLEGERREGGRTKEGEH